MADVWKSQPRKFCDICKCWIADNKACIDFHENGKRHKQNLEKKLSDIRYRGAVADKRAKKEEQWIQQMERAAMQDYRDKDLLKGSDMTARIFNEKKAERDAEKAAIEAATSAARSAYEIGGGGPGPSSVGPRAPSPPGGEGGGSLKPVEAPKSGTKWHKEKKWFEAVTEEGHTYFWHVETHESRWDAPPEGHFSIKEQEEINDKHEKKEVRKIEKIYESQSIHGTHREDAGLPVPTVSRAHHGPQARSSPYGEWKAVEPRPQKRQTSAVLDFQAPRNTEPAKSSVALHHDRPVHFGQRKTPKLEEADGILQPKSSGQVAITFKKRKLSSSNRKNIRRRDEDD